MSAGGSTITAHSGQPSVPAPIDGGSSGPKAAKKGRKKGAKGYSSDEMTALLRYIGEILPCGANMWVEVEDAMRPEAESKGWPERDAEAYKEKFTRLKNTSKPTGSARPKPFVAQAKALQKKIARSFYEVCIDGEEEGDFDEDEDEDAEVTEDREDEAESEDGQQSVSDDSSGTPSK
jgi:hypothetical protein